MLRENITENATGQVWHGVRVQVLQAQVIPNAYVHFLVVGHFTDLFLLLLAMQQLDLRSQ